MRIVNRHLLFSFNNNFKCDFRVKQYFFNVLPKHLTEEHRGVEDDEGHIEVLLIHKHWNSFSRLSKDKFKLRSLILTSSTQNSLHDFNPYASAPTQIISFCCNGLSRDMVRSHVVYILIKPTTISQSVKSLIKHRRRQSLIFLRGNSYKDWSILHRLLQDNSLDRILWQR